MSALLLVAVGGALGGALRWGLSGVVAHRFGETFPWGTWTVNVTGCFAIGLLAVAVASAPTWALLIAGVMGSFTTVSSFSMQTLMLMQDGEWKPAALNVGLSAVACLGGVATGQALGAWLFPRALL